MQDDLTAAGRERWRQLADEAAFERRARTVAPVRRAPIRATLAAALVALADRLAPAPGGLPESAQPITTTPPRA